MLSDDTYGELLLDCMPPCDPLAPPRAVRVVINSDLLRIVEECGMDLSAVCERGVTEQVRLHMLYEWRRLRASGATPWPRAIDRNAGANRLRRRSLTKPYPAEQQADDDRRD